MNQIRQAFKIVALSLFVFVAVSSASAQGPPDPQRAEPSYEISLHVLIGSNEAAPRGTEVPSSLSAISRQLKNNFSFSSYRLVNTYLGRISNTGNIEYKSISNILGQEPATEAQSFLEWSIVGLRSMQNGFQGRSFRFGARVPIKTSKDENAVVYESVGLTMQMIGLPANTPTLVGTISLPKTTGTIFLVATIKSAEM
jgi:hypothetical protein